MIPGLRASGCARCGAGAGSWTIDYQSLFPGCGCSKTAAQTPPSTAPWHIAGCGSRSFIAHQVFIKLFYKRQCPHKFVQLSFNITNIENKSTDVYENRLLQNDFINTISGIRTVAGRWPSRNVLLQRGERSRLLRPRYQSSWAHQLSEPGSLSAAAQPQDHIAA